MILGISSGLPEGRNEPLCVLTRGFGRHESLRAVPAQRVDGFAPPPLADTMAAPFVATDTRGSRLDDSRT